MKHILKSYYGDVFFEFLTHPKAQDAVIILEGFPSSNDREEEMRWLYSQGYNVFYPRYRGTFQSHGRFLSADPSETMADFVRELDSGEARSLWDDDTKSFENEDIHLLTGSFGGCVSLAVADATDAASATLFSPVWDFTEHNEVYDEQDLDHITSFVQRAYQHIFRFEFDDVKEAMARFPACQPSGYLPVTGTDVVVFHDEADEVTAFEHSDHYVPRLDDGELRRREFGHGLTTSLLGDVF